MVILASLVWAVQNQTFPTPAQAICVGGTSYPEHWVDAAGLYALEETRDNSCDYNGHYLGRVRDMRQESPTNKCVYSEWRDGGYTGIQGSSCDSAGYRYAFWDQTGDSYAEYRVRRTDFYPGYWYTSGY